MPITGLKNLNLIRNTFPQMLEVRFDLTITITAITKPKTDPHNLMDLNIIYMASLNWQEKNDYKVGMFLVNKIVAELGLVWSQFSLKISNIKCLQAGMSTKMNDELCDQIHKNLEQEKKYVMVRLVS